MKEPKLLKRIPDLSNNRPMVVRTNIDTGECARELHVYYQKGNTYVVPSGEAENADPWGYHGIMEFTDVLSWYLISVLRHDDMDVDPADL
jgi:hypothetical protein